MKVYFIGAGPGDPELLTLKGKSVIEQADIVIYAGSLVNPKILQFAKPGIRIYNSAKMNLEEVTEIYTANRNTEGVIARLHTGDPSMYGAIQEQIDFCRNTAIPTEVIPGVSSFFAAAAALQTEYTLPGITQTLILTRLAGRTPVPDSEDLEELARHRSSMAIFLSASKIKEVAEKLSVYYPSDTPVSVVYRASWPDEKIISSTLADISEKMEGSGITKQALILVGEALRSLEESDFYEKSKLYDPGFTTEYRKGTGTFMDNKKT